MFIHIIYEEFYMKSTYNFKAIVLGHQPGDSTTLIYRLVANDSLWPFSNISTIGIEFKLLKFDDASNKVQLRLWDLAGQERFGCPTSSYLKDVNIIILFLNPSLSLDSYQKMLEDFSFPNNTHINAYCIPVLKKTNQRDTEKKTWHDSLTVLVDDFVKKHQTKFKTLEKSELIQDLDITQSYPTQLADQLKKICSNEIIKEQDINSESINNSSTTTLIPTEETSSFENAQSSKPKKTTSAKTAILSFFLKNKNKNKKENDQEQELSNLKSNPENPFKDKDNDSDSDSSESSYSPFASRN